MAVCESDARVSLGCGVSLRSVQLRGLQIVSHRLRSVLQSLVGRGQVILQVCDPLASLARLCARQDIQPLLRLARLHVRRAQIKRTGALQSLLSELKTRANHEALLCVSVSDMADVFSDWCQCRNTYSQLIDLFILKHKFSDNKGVTKIKWVEFDWLLTAATRRVKDEWPKPVF